MFVSKLILHFYNFKKRILNLDYECISFTQTIFIGHLLEKNIHLINSCSELHSKIVIKNDFIFLNNDLDM